MRQKIKTEKTRRIANNNIIRKHLQVHVFITLFSLEMRMSARAYRSLTSSASEVECCLFLCAAGVLLLETDGKRKNNEEYNFGYYEILNKNCTCFFLFSFFFSLLSSYLPFSCPPALSVHHFLTLAFALAPPIGYFVCFRAHSFLSSFHFALFSFFLFFCNSYESERRL